MENIVAKGEIGCLSNFCFCHNVFKNHMLQRHQKASIWGKRLNALALMLSSLHINDWRQIPLWNHYHYLVRLCSIKKFITNLQTKFVRCDIESAFLSVCRFITMSFYNYAFEKRLWLCFSVSSIPTASQSCLQGY